MSPFLKYSDLSVVIASGSGGFMGRGSLVAVASFIASTVAGAATVEDTGRESLHATLWMQVAPEYRAITEQV